MRKTYCKTKVRWENTPAWVCIEYTNQAGAEHNISVR